MFDEFRTLGTLRELHLDAESITLLHELVRIHVFDAEVILFLPVGIVHILKVRHATSNKSNGFCKSVSEK